MTWAADDSTSIDPKVQVRASYNRIAEVYLSSRRRDSPDVALLEDPPAASPPGHAFLTPVAGLGSQSLSGLRLMPRSSASTLPTRSSTLPNAMCPRGFGSVRTWSPCPLPMHRSTLSARTTPSFTSHGNNTPAFWMALRVCYGPVGWPYFALALWTFLPGRSSTMMRRCTRATTMQRRAFRS